MSNTMDQKYQFCTNTRSKKQFRINYLMPSKNIGCFGKEDNLLALGMDTTFIIENMKDIECIINPLNT